MRGYAPAIGSVGRGTEGDRGATNRPRNCQRFGAPASLDAPLRRIGAPRGTLPRIQAPFGARATSPRNFGGGKRRRIAQTRPRRIRCRPCTARSLGSRIGRSLDAQRPQRRQGCRHGNSGGHGRRGSSPLCPRPLSHVSALRGAKRLEGGNRLRKPFSVRRLQGSHLAHQRQGRMEVAPLREWRPSRSARARHGVVRSHPHQRRHCRCLARSRRSRGGVAGGRFGD